MGCTYTTAGSTPDKYLACIGKTASFPESAVSNYADQAGCSGGQNNWIRVFAISCLRVNRLIFYTDPPTVCGQPGQGGTGAALIQKAAQSALSAVPVVGNALSALTSFLPFEHHAVAVQNERQTLCAATNNWNAFSDQMERALANKQIGLQDAIATAKQVHDSVRQQMASVASASQKNAGYGFQLALDALLLFNTQAIYPGLVPSASSALGSVSSTLSQVGNSISSAISALTGGTPSSSLLPASSSSQAIPGMQPTSGSSIGVIAVATAGGIIIAKVVGLF